MTWRAVHASVPGTSHKSSNAECQDAHSVHIVQSNSGATFLIAVVSDGAGSAQFGGEGAVLACAESTAEFVDCLGRRSHIEEADILRSISRARAALSIHSERRGVEMRQYACTLLGVVAGDNETWFFQCGDGVIVAGRKAPLGVVFWPEAGEYANMTYFITDDEWRTHLQFEHASQRFTDIALLTDGLQRLALLFSEQAVFSPFFAPMFARLRDQQFDGDIINKQLSSFLDSAPVNARTDDDKTLVLAVREMMP